MKHIAPAIVVACMLLMSAAAAARSKSAVVRGLVPTDATGRDRTRRYDAGLTGR